MNASGEWIINTSKNPNYYNNYFYLCYLKNALTKAYLTFLGEKMIISLVTPLMIASAPMTVPVEPLKYSHETQQVQSQEFQVSQRMITFNGTQTFGADGRPRDADND